MSTGPPKNNTSSPAKQFKEISSHASKAIAMRDLSDFFRNQIVRVVWGFLGKVFPPLSSYQKVNFLNSD